MLQLLLWIIIMVIHNTYNIHNSSSIKKYLDRSYVYVCVYIEYVCLCVSVWVKRPLAAAATCAVDRGRGRRRAHVTTRAWRGGRQTRGLGGGIRTTFTDTQRKGEGGIGDWEVGKEAHAARWLSRHPTCAASGRSQHAGSAPTRSASDHIPRRAQQTR